MAAWTIWMVLIYTTLVGQECRAQVDIAFLLDGSGSVEAADFEKMKVFVQNVVGSDLGKDTKFSIAQFATGFKAHSYFNTFDVNNKNEIQGIKQLKGGTNTAAAIKNVVQDVFSPQRGSRPNVKKILIVITDGESNDRVNLTSAVNFAESKNIVRFAIGVGSAFIKPEAKQELEIIASSLPKNHVFQVESFGDLERIRQNLQEEITETRARADIAFLLDGSESIDIEDFQRMKDFAQNVVSSFVVKNIKFSLAQFSTGTNIHCYFDTFDANNWQNQIQGIKQLNGSTHTAAAIRHVVRQVFSPNRGSRGYVKKILIVITDGQSADDQTALASAAMLTESKNIVRFVIGVGEAFTNGYAKQQLDIVASSPAGNHVFPVKSVEALERIRQYLEDEVMSSKETRARADTAFLLDGSDSIYAEDFQRMKNFVQNVVGLFLGEDTRVAIAQFSTGTTVHYHFDTFDANNWQNEIEEIKKMDGSTYTAAAIRHVVQDVFSKQRGSRPHVKRILIVITDGQSSDGQSDLANVANLTESNNIVRFVIGVGEAFTNSHAKQQLDIIASSPPEDHVFQVDSVHALECIRQQLVI